MSLDKHYEEKKRKNISPSLGNPMDVSYTKMFRFCLDKKCTMTKWWRRGFSAYTQQYAFAVVMVGVHELIENTKFMNIRLGLNRGSSVVYTCVCMYTV